MAETRRVLNRYRLVERIALGGTAEVWRAHDEQLDRPVAVKRLHAHLLPDEASRRRLAGEARAAASLTHPAIVEIYDIDVTGEAAALVMELVEGESLAARIDREGALPERDAALVAADVADALFHAHQRGVIHRDVKPGNILLDEGGRAHLVDFGIARSLAESAEKLTLTGTVIGTLRYMAPEQLSGGKTGPRTDLYGLGAVLHEALTSEPPFRAASPVALADEQRGPPPAMMGVDPALAALTRACLAAEPTDRPLHAGALAAALRHWLDGNPESAYALTESGKTTIPSILRRNIDPHAVTQPVAAAPAALYAGAQARPAPWWLSRSATLVPTAIAGVVLGLALFAVLSGQAARSSLPPTASPSPAFTPAPPPVPEWAAKLLEDYVEECGADTTVVQVEIAGMVEDEAEEHVKQLVEACKGEAEEGGGTGGGEGGGGEGGRGGNGGGEGGGGEGGGGEGGGGG